jgi:hypothetical protein
VGPILDVAVSDHVVCTLSFLAKFVLQFESIELANVCTL